MPVLTKSELAAQIEELIVTSGLGQVSAADVRSVFTDITDSLALQSPAINAQADAAYTLALADAGRIVEMADADANVVTIPAEADVDMPLGALINVVQTGAGETTVQAAAGVTLNGVTAGGAAVTAIYAGVALYKRGADEWVMQGAHGAVA